MRFYFNSIRYSEDLDIDVQIILKDTLQKKIQSILNATPFKNILKARGIEIASISMPKQTETTQRWKISLKISGSALPLQTKIEFSRRSVIDAVSYEPINNFLLSQHSLPLIIANHYTLQSMYEQKIKALALRTETQARDVFDIYYLLKTHPNLKPIQTLHSQLETAKKNALSIRYSDFKGQVVSYLSSEEQENYNNPDSWSHIVSEVIQSLEKIS